MQMANAPPESGLDWGTTIVEQETEVAPNVPFAVTLPDAENLSVIVPALPSLSTAWYSYACAFAILPAIPFHGSTFQFVL